jgi:pimeloyl-ACP methyl ester carboxylesterase
VKSRDAVVVVPGIMGSELMLQETGETLWGLRSAEWYRKAWASGSSLRALELSDEERGGRYGRIRATRLLRFPAYAPFLRGFEPYTNLVRALRRRVLHPAAVAEFPYDWRLPVSHNAVLLADAAQRHLATWRRHPSHDDVQRTGQENEPALVLVAHSMGGLLCSQLSVIPGAMDNVRAVITLGTPFYGAPNADFRTRGSGQGPSLS